MTGLVVFVVVVAVGSWTVCSLVYARRLVLRWRYDPARVALRRERQLRRDARRLPATHLAELYRAYEALTNDARRQRQQTRHDADVAGRLAHLDQCVAQGEARQQMIGDELLRRGEYWRVLR